MVTKRYKNVKFRPKGQPAVFEKSWENRIEELRTKQLIDSEVAHELKKILKSPDAENKELVKSIIKEKVKEKLLEGLNKNQADAFIEMTSFLEDPQHQAFVLKGYAGTGKTFLIKRVIEYILQNEVKAKIAITAPTNKAVRVLYDSAKTDEQKTQSFIFEDIFHAGYRMTYATIHRLMGMREVITEDGKQLFVTSNDSKINDYSYLIVDEVSMLDDNICHMIMSKSDKIKIIFMGDAAQIPPVNKVDSIPLLATQKTYNFKSAELSEIMRQKGDNAIIEYSTCIRENLSIPDPIKKLTTRLNKEDHGIIHLDSVNDRQQIIPVLKEYFLSPNYKQIPNYMCVLAWRNDTVRYMNGLIREIIYGDVKEPYLPGEKLVAIKPIYSAFEKIYADGKTRRPMIFTTSEEFSVDKIELSEMLIEGEAIKYYRVTPDDNDKAFKILHKDSEVIYKQFLKIKRAEAIQAKNVKIWEDYYKFSREFANVGYAYALTCHKSQGSTYKNIMLLEEDLDFNRKIVERNRIKYTGYTRASDKLYVLRYNK